MDYVILIARLALAGIFIASGFLKFADPEGSKAGFTEFGIPESLAKPGAILLPLAEIVLALLLLPMSTAWYAAAGLTLLLVVFTGGITFNVIKGRKVSCHCFGQMSTAPVSWRSVIRNAVFLVIALVILVQGPGPENMGQSLWDLLGGLSTMEWVIGIIAVVALAGVIAQTWLLVHLLGQNGRLLIRMDELEASVAAGGGMLLEEGDEEEAEEPQSGLPVGSTAPGFKLEGIFGETMTLDALRAQGKPVMLVFSDPGCGPCNALMPDLGKWQRENAAKLTIALISRGGAEANQSKVKEHGITNVLLQKDREIAQLYEANGTPTGVVIDADGKVASSNAPGADAIRRLVERFTGAVPAPVAAAQANGQAARQQPRPAAPSNVGKPAPAVSLPDLDGKTVSLADFKGKKTLVLFWNPGCGFCKRMVDDLKGWESKKPKNAPELLIVSTGTAESNRELGLASVTLLDQGFNVGRSFGASGTPSAVLVGPDGNLLSNVAVGQPSVMALANGEDPAKVAPPQQGGGERPRPQGIPKGKPAPEVKLKDVDGNQWDLKSQRGKDTMLVFWNPGCGFCKKMVDELKGWESSKPGNAPDIVLVSTGTAESNKALGLASKTLLDDGFATGRQFGATGTPSAILIDKNGNVASEVQVGGPNVMALAGAAQKA